MKQTFKKYKGWAFRDWCLLDLRDERKINYKVFINGEERNFTSEDEIDIVTFYFIKDAIIHSLELIDNEWYVTLI